MAKATRPVKAPIPTDPVALLSTPLAASGLAAGAALQRAGRKLDVYDVRDLLFHLPRRYDDLREMRKLGDLFMVADGDVISAVATVGDVRVEPGFRGRTQRTIARLEDVTGGIDATWFGRRFIERRLHVGAEVVVSGRERWILSEDEPDIVGYDQALWVAALEHNEDDPSRLVATFAALRDANLDLWARRSLADRERIGRHRERGAESYDMTFRLAAGHDRIHLAQARRALAAVVGD